MNRNRFWNPRFGLAAAALLLLAGPVIAQHDHGMAQQDREQALRVGKKGEITFSKALQAGDVTLKPGRYTIQHRVDGDNHFIHFTQVTEPIAAYNIRGGDAKAHPGEVACRLEPLQAKARNTMVYIETEGGVARITKIIIAGESVAHLL